MITEYQQKLRERYLTAPVMPAPEPWQPVLDRRTPIGGLLGIGFAVHPDSGHDLVMVVSSDGHGLFDAVTGEKIVRALPTTGTAVLNADDPLVAAMRREHTGRIITFGTGENADVRATGIDTADGRPAFTLHHQGRTAPVRLTLHGRHNVTNALAAAATALAAGVPFDTVAAALSDARMATGGRMAVTTRADGVTIINDAFNASPESVLAALDALGDVGRDR
ncbi:Mur ligase family protein, partial [Streptomyces sp. NPDC058861]|uniref:Mur ligase family protein n=1 Tax=Streptomyces sp. NPDC058861 TaxID=3346653 RepID=UPI0036CD7E26